MLIRKKQKNFRHYCSIFIRVYATITNKSATIISMQCTCSMSPGRENSTIKSRSPSLSSSKSSDMKCRSMTTTKHYSGSAFLRMVRFRQFQAVTPLSEPPHQLSRALFHAGVLPSISFGRRSLGGSRLWIRRWQFNNNASQR